MQVCTHPRKGEMLVCPVIVTRDLDHYFAIHSVVDPPEALLNSLLNLYVSAMLT